MREIDLDTPDTQLPTNTFLLYGDMRTGKSTWLASMPRVLILADATEQGWESVRHIDDAFLFEPGIKPIVWALEHPGDLVKAIELATPLINAGTVRSLGVDSISFYVDMMLKFYIEQQTKYDARQAYGHLGNHLRDIRVRLHQLQVNVAWLALAKHPDAEDPVGRPLIPGQQADKFCAGVHYIFHSRVEQVKKDGKVVDRVFEMRTQSYKNYIAGNRLGSKAELLPDPLVGNYADFITAIGYDPDTLRASLVPYKRPVRLAAGSNVAAPIAKPPVVNKGPAIKMIAKQ